MNFNRLYLIYRPAGFNKYAPQDPQVKRGFKYKSMPTGVYKRKSSKIKRTCEYCGKGFCVIPSLVKRGYGNFCSRVCRNKGRRLGFKKGKDNYAYKSGQRRCIDCGKEIGWNKNTKRCISCFKIFYHNEFLKREKVKKSKRKIRARLNNRKGKTYQEIYGEQWKEEIEKRKKSINKFWDKHGKVKYVRPRHEGKDYINWRKAVFKRDSYTCGVCGIRGSKLNAHHLKKWSKYPELRLDVNNGMTLCVFCHWVYTKFR